MHSVITHGAPYEPQAEQHQNDSSDHPEGARARNQVDANNRPDHHTRHGPGEELPSKRSGERAVPSISQQGTGSSDDVVEQVCWCH